MLRKKELKLKGDLTSFREFLDDTDILGDSAGSVYHQWIDRLCRFIESKKRILVLYGSYGIGKSYIPKILLLWNLYLITKIDDLRGFFGHAPTSVISLMLYSPSMGDIGAEDIEELASMIQNSPYFSRVCPIIKKDKKSIRLKGRIRIVLGKDKGSARSKNLWFAVIDEANFLSENSKIANKRAKSVFQECKTRIKNRWGLPSYYESPHMGMIVISSSSDSSDSFVEKVISEGMKTNTVHVERIAKYDIDPIYKDSERFNVFEGEGEVPPHIMRMPDSTIHNQEFYRNVSIDNIIANLYGVSYDEFFESRKFKIHNPPIELLSYYEEDIIDSLQTHSGVPVVSGSRLFKSMKSVQASVVDHLQDPLLFDEVPILMGNSTQFEDCINSDILIRNYKGGQVFFHIDQSKNKDATGLAFVEKNPNEPFRVLLVIRVVPSKANNVDMMRVAEIPIYLRNAFGWNITYGTYDGYQSEPIIQSLSKYFGKGIRGNGTKYDRIVRDSVENSDPYLTLVDLFRRGNIQMYHHEYLFKELTYLQLFKADNKVDHPESFDTGEVGSKDLADALCGAIKNGIEILGLDNIHMIHQTVKEYDTRVQDELEQGLDDIKNILQGTKTNPYGLPNF